MNFSRVTGNFVVDVDSNPPSVTTEEVEVQLSRLLFNFFNWTFTFVVVNKEEIKHLFLKMVSGPSIAQMSYFLFWNHYIGPNSLKLEFINTFGPIGLLFEASQGKKPTMGFRGIKFFLFRKLIIVMKKDALPFTVIVPLVLPKELGKAIAKSSVKRLHSPN